MADTSSKTQSFIGVVELFPQDKGWYFVRVPLELSEPLQAFADRGLIAVSAAVGSQIWDTSLLPMGDGTHFIALSAKVRKKEKINLGDNIEVSFALRDRNPSK